MAKSITKPIQNEETRIYVEFEKRDEEKRMVYGYASTEALDSQNEVVTKEAISGSLADYMKFGNVREMHQPSAVGKTLKTEMDDKGLWIGVKVVDDNAWKKVKEGVYNGFSIGGIATMKEDKGDYNVVTGLKLKEISLVDRPANQEAVFEMIKVDDVAEDPKVEAETLAESEEKAEAEVEVKEEEQEVVEAEKEATDEEKTEEVETEEVKEETEAPEKEEETTEEAPVEEVKEVADTEEDVTKDAGTVMSAASMIMCLNDMKSDLTDKASIKALDAAIKALKAVVGAANDAPEMEMNDMDMPMEMADKPEDMLKAYEMPTDEEIAAELTKAGVEVNEKSIGIYKEVKSKEIVEKLNSERVEAEKIEGFKHELNKRLSVLADQLKNTLANATPEEKQEVAEKLSKAEEVKEEVVEEPVTEVPVIEETATEEVTKIEKTETVDLKKYEEAVSKFEMELAKASQLITSLEERITKFEQSEVPTSVNKGIYVVEKFSANANPASELEKVEKEISELSVLLKSDPNNATLRQKADELSNKWLELKRNK